MPPIVSNTSSLKRRAEEELAESKKPRRSPRNANKQHGTPLKSEFPGFPSPVTQESSASVTEQKKTKQPAVSEKEKLEDAKQQRTPSSSPPHDPHHSVTMNKSSQIDPNATQPFSQFIYPSQDSSIALIDEEKEGVWGYLQPLDGVFGQTLILRSRVACPAPPPRSNFGRGTKSREQGENGEDFNTEEDDYEKAKDNSGLPAGGYLIGRHHECDRVINSATVSNRHCLIYNEHKNGDTIAVLEDLSSNGTYVNDKLIGRNKRRELHDNDEIRILNETKFLYKSPRTKQGGSAFRQQYQVLEQLGKGHFATVYLCVEKSTGTRFAVKRFQKHGTDEKARSATEGLQQEIAVLMSVSHPNLLCLKDTFDETDAIYLILELAAEGELFNWIISHTKLSEKETRKLFIQLFEGTKYLHERGIVHRDFKPENILLVDKDLTAKIADFGLAKIIGEESFTTTLCGTPSYVAPEILENSDHRRYTRAVDVWSLGVVLYICLCGFPPFSDDLYTARSPYNLSQQIKMGKFDFPSPYWDSVEDPALDLIERMLRVDPNERYTIEQCLAHPWITLEPPRNSLADSTDGLVGAIGSLDFKRRKVTRERTLLSEINDVLVSKVIKTDNNEDPIKVWHKNDEYTRVVNSQGNKNGTKNKNGTAKNRDDLVIKAGNANNERTPGEFMQIGGKPGQPLFGNDVHSKYPKN